MLWCLHGALGAYRDWESIFPGARHVDLWSTKPGTDLANWANQWVTTVAEEDPHPQLVGYSMGGRLALHALLAAPTLWESATIVSAHPGLRSGRAERRVRDKAWLARFQREPFQNVMRDWNAQSVFSKESGPPNPKQFEPRMARCFQQWSLGNQEPLWEQLDNITCPVQWICGELDTKFSQLGRDAVAMLPQATYLSTPSCGHRVPWEWSDFASHLALSM
ncbi:MAG: alpha/beta fold hydrolase [Verrucomicrobiaceae bacterium]|nr:alpha/beta fold hydrolase [Verrucomicrobiaceae bacterium]